MIATNEELALLEKWKRKLCLQEWRIKLLTHLHPEEMMVRNTTGCTEWSEAIKTARMVRTWFLTTSRQSSLSITP